MRDRRDVSYGRSEGCETDPPPSKEKDVVAIDSPWLDGMVDTPYSGGREDESIATHATTKKMESLGKSVVTVHMNQLPRSVRHMVIVTGEWNRKRPNGTKKHPARGCVTTEKIGDIRIQQGSTHPDVLQLVSSKIKRRVPPRSHGTSLAVAVEGHPWTNYGTTGRVATDSAFKSHTQGECD